MPEEKTILVIDDGEMIRSLACKILGHAGYGVVAVASGEEGLGRLRSQPEEIALVIVDYILDGLFGVGLIRSLRQVAPEIPIVLSSGETIKISDLPDGLRFNISILSKPYNATEMAEVIRTALTSRSPSYQ